MPRPRPGPRVRLLLVGLAIASLLGCSGQRPAPSAPPATTHERLAEATATPPFYRVESRVGASLWLMGTVHVGPSTGWRFSPELLSALDEARALVLEVDLRAVDDEAVGSILAETGLLPPSTELRDVVAPETTRWLEERDEQLTAMGLPYDARKRFEPWFLAIGLIERATAQSGYPTSQAVEQALLARLGDRPVIGLETFREQLALLDGLSPAQQDLMLRDTLQRLDDTVSEIETLLVAWARNDEDALVAATHLGSDESSELAGLYEILLGDRNRRWLERLRGWLDDPERRGETLFVAVGAGHLVGRDDLVGLLRDAGYAVAPVEQTGTD